MADTREVLLVRGRAALPAGARAGRGELRLSDALAESLGERVPARVLKVGAGLRLDARLSRSAPPGRHSAVLVVDGEETRVTIDVAERRRLRFRPGTLRLTGRPGGKASASVVLENLGNVPVDLPAGSVSGLFASDGVAGAFAGAYAVESDDHEEIFGAFVHGLRRGFLGLAKLTLSAEKEKGPLAPGEARALLAEVQIPRGGKKAQTGAGRRFHATFAFESARLGVRLLLEAPDTPATTTGRQGARS